MFASVVGLNPAGPRPSMKLFSVLLALTLGVTALWVGPTAAAEKKYVTDPTTGKVVSAPGYGGDTDRGLRTSLAGSDAWFGHPTMKLNEQVPDARQS